MPWEHCGNAELGDDAVCPGCGIAKAAWTVEWNVTRNFRVTRSSGLRLEVVKGAEGAPVAGLAFFVIIGDRRVSGVTDELGKATVPGVPDGAEVTLGFPGRGPGELIAPEGAEPLEEEASDAALGLGSEGEEVRALQRQLAAAGFPVDEDGQFGPETAHAVRWLQEERGLRVDGKVGPAVRAALATARPRAAPGGPALRLGDLGGHVRALQQALVDAGAALTVDGCFDLSTRRAVKAFQAERGLAVDGRVGPETWAALLGAPAPAAAAGEGLRFRVRGRRARYAFKLDVAEWVLRPLRGFDPIGLTWRVDLSDGRTVEGSVDESHRVRVTGLGDATARLTLELDERTRFVSDPDDDGIAEPEDDDEVAPADDEAAEDDGGAEAEDEDDGVAADAHVAPFKREGAQDAEEAE